MAAWAEVANAKKENRCELILSGSAVSQRLEKDGLTDELFLCKNLNFLCISETCLKEVSPKIKMLYNLTSLVLHSNNLTELCPEIQELTKLKFLNVSNNQIEEIPDGIGKLEALTTLNASSNKIQKMPDLSKNVMLSTVDFSHNLLTDMSNLCHSQLTHLAEVHLKGNKIQSVPSAIKELTALKMLDMSNNEVSQVAGELGDISKLKDVNLQSNPLADKKLAKIILQGKSKQVLDYVRVHCPKENSTSGGTKEKKGKTKGKGKQSQEEQETVDSNIPCKHKIVVLKSDDTCNVKKTKFVQEIRPHILACIVKNVSWDVDILKKFLQLQNKMHDGICDKRNIATIATHDLSLCKGRTFSYTALSPETLKITPLSRNKEFTGKELFTQLQIEAENLRKEKKRNTYFGIHKFLHLLEGKPLYPCMLNAENTIISFPPLTNSDLTKQLSVDTKEILVEVTSSGSQGHCKHVLDTLLKEMVQQGIGTVNENDCLTLTIEPVKIEEPEGALIAVYPSRVDLDFGAQDIQVVRN
ncbi:hypothetical protein RUM43_010232 [Polyplax serrata]|uniref:B3/B4 tRNA-binding domain-containing protein n=1 Tax=Polyplax serrata TaxID=468196 RepID=A0AAN8PL34_POLSC